MRKVEMFVADDGRSFPSARAVMDYELQKRLIEVLVEIKPRAALERVTEAIGQRFEEIMPIMLEHQKNMAEHLGKDS